MSGLLTSSATGDQLQFHPAAKWIVEREFRLPESAASAAPFSILLLDRQYFLRADACFVRHVRQINHQEAAEKLSKVNIPFASQREHLTLHWIRIWRDGVAVEQVRSTEDLDLTPSALPNRVAAHFTLEDLRPGDCLDVAYTVKSSSPADHFSAIQPLRQRVPILDWHLSAIVPPDTQLHSSQATGLLASPARQLSEGSRFHDWRSSDVPAMLQPASAPDWYQANPEIQLSTFASWADVASEIHHAWQVPASCPSSEALAKTMTAAAESDPWEAARLACRYVQDQITTLPSRELALAPADPPAQTVERCEGDAKAKSCLLVCLLRAIGIPSAPVLVSRSRARSLASALPAPDLFDQVLVRGRIDDTDFWIDPCARSEGGRIQDTVLPVYCAGLQIGPRTNKLCALPGPSQNANQLTITEQFIIDAGLQASATISTRATGLEANRLRACLAEHGAPQLAGDRLAAFEQRHPGSIRVGELSIDDNPETNEIAIAEEFQIPKLAQSDANGARFSPIELERRLPSLPAIPSHGDSPVSLPFPCNVRQLTVIDTPWELDASESAEHLPGSGFSISFKGNQEGRRHSLRFAYSTHDDHIIPSEIKSAQLRLEQMRPHLDYRVTLPAAPTPSSKGSRIIKEVAFVEGDKVGERKKSPHSGAGMIRPLLGAAAAVALVFLIRSTFNERAAQASTAIKEKKIAEISAEPESPVIEELPDYRDNYKPIPKIQVPEPSVLEDLEDPIVEDSDAPNPEPSDVNLDDVGFGAGEGEAETEGKAGENKNATSGDWKLSG